MRLSVISLIVFCWTSLTWANDQLASILIPKMGTTGGAGGGLHGKDPKHFFHHYIKVHVSGDEVGIEVKRIDRKARVMDLFSFMKDYGPEWGLFTGLLISLFTLGLSITKDYRKSKGKPV